MLTNLNKVVRKHSFSNPHPTHHIHKPCLQSCYVTFFFSPFINKLTLTKFIFPTMQQTLTKLSKNIPLTSILTNLDKPIGKHPFSPLDRAIGKPNSPFHKNVGKHSFSSLLRHSYWETSHVNISFSLYFN